MCKYTDGSLILEDDKSKSLLEIIPDSYFARGEFEILSEEDKEIDIDKDLIIGINEQGNEYLEYKNDGSTESGYSRNYSKYDILIVKAIKQLDKKIK